jgi:hypothetical protein
MLVAVSAPLQVRHRCRLELLPVGSGRFVYHQAAELPLADAAELIEATRTAAETTAVTAIGDAIQDFKVIGACLPTGSTTVPDDLAAVLRSHPRIHTAEGALYAGAIASACAKFGIPVITVRERDVWGRASVSTGLAEAELKARIDALRKTLGAPWTADHKIATAAALVQVRKA